MPKYPAKLLLFGEYTIIKGAEALAMPLASYSGCWKMARADQKIVELQQDLPKLWKYLMTLDKTEQLLSALDLAAFRQDISEGLYFDSSIPGGYGVGSSGALCAAIYDRYILNPLSGQVVKLREQVAQIESFFHGASSGIDPLVAYLGSAVHILSSDKLRKAELSIARDQAPVLFLIDTHISRNTAPFVNLFLEKCKEASFRKNGLEPLVEANNQAIATFLNGDWLSLFLHFRQISQLQADHFQEMIPETFKEVWQQGLAGEKFLLKLCGAGGGGFILGITNDWENVQQELKHLKPEQAWPLLP